MNTTNKGHNIANIRVLLAHLPEPIVQLLEREFEARHSLQLVNSVHDDIQLLSQVTQGIDVVVLGVHDEVLPPGLVTHLLGAIPNLRIVILQVQDDQVIEYWLGLRHRHSYPHKISDLADIISRIYEYDLMD